MSAPARILFPFVGGDVIGGSHVSALRMIAGLDRERFAPLVLLHGTPGALARRIEATGLQWMPLTAPGIVAPRYSRRPEDLSALGYLTRGVAALTALLRQLRIDIVHTNDGRMHGNWALPARLAGCRFVWHHRQDPDAFGVNRIAPLLAHRIVCVSDFARPSHPIVPVGRRVRVIRSPFDCPADGPDRAAAAADLRRRIGAPADAVVVGYVGVLNQRKRPQHFVQALAALQAALPQREVRGVVMGAAEQPGDPVAAELAQLAARLGVERRLHLLGHVSPVEPALAGLDALWVTALGEPFGRTLIEAMHLGTPVIATASGGNPEAIRDGVTGFLVDPHDPGAFTAPTRRLLEMPGEADRIASAAQVGLARYGTPEHLRHMQQLYADLLDGNHEPQA